MRDPDLSLIVIFIGILFLSACAAQEPAPEAVEVASEPAKVVLVSGSNEYFSHISLKEYKQYLEEHHDNLQVKLLQAEGELNERKEYSELPGVEALDEADVALFFSRRLTIGGDQLERIKRYVEDGGNVVALRTASHGFQNWLEFDKVVLGGNYHGHHPGSPEEMIVNAQGALRPEGEPTGPITKVELNPENRGHPILAGITDFESKYSLYETSPVAEDVNVLMTGMSADRSPEPVVWTRSYNGGRVVYIGQGGLQDFENPTFRQLVTNALLWAANRN